MFSIDPARTHLAIDPAAVVALYRSVNQVHVAVGGAAGTARAVIVGHRAAGGAFAVHLALHLPEVRRTAVYVQDGPPLDAADAREAGEEAIAFLESMGFFLESVGWDALGLEGRAALWEGLGVFAPPPVEEDEHQVVDPRTTLARLLVQL